MPAGTFSDDTAVSSIAHAGQQRHDGNDAPDACGDAGQPICAVANGVRIIVPPGSAESDIACALRSFSCWDNLSQQAWEEAHEEV